MTFLFLIIVPMLIGFWAQMKVKSAYGKYSAVASRNRITGREAAEAVMQSASITMLRLLNIMGL